MSRPVRVVLPAPEGEDTMNRRGELFDILHLLAHPFRFRLQFDDQVRKCCVLALGAQGIRLPTYFLQEKIHASSRRLGGLDERTKLFEMALEASELLGHTRSGRHECYLLFQAPGFNDDIGVIDQTRYPFTQLVTVMLDRCGGAFSTGADKHSSAFE